MNKKIYASIAALTLLCGAGAVTSYAVSDGTEPAIVPAGVPDQPEIRPRTPEFTMVFDIKDGTPYFKGTVTVPVTGSLPDYSDVALTTVKKISVYRQGESYSDPAVLVREWENCEAGTDINFEIQDESLEIGKEYTYTAVATQDLDSYSGYASVKFGVTPRSPEKPKVEETEDGTKLKVTYACPVLEQNLGSSWYPDWRPVPEGVKHTKIDLYVIDDSRNEVILRTDENPVEGQEFEYVDANPKPGVFNTYYARVSTNYGDSEYSSGTYFYGDDYPAKVNGVTAVEKDGKVEVSWTAPTEGYNGGRFDPSKTVYAVYRAYDNYGSDMKLLVNNYKETTYVDDLADLTGEKMVWYRVVPSNDVEPTSSYVYNYGETTNGMLVGPPSQLPFAESFNNGTNKFNKNFDNLMQSDFDYNCFSDYYIRYDMSSVRVSDNVYLSLIAGIGGGTMDDELGPDAFFYVTPSSWSEALGAGTLTTGSLSFEGCTNPVASFWYVPINDNSGEVTLQISKGDVDADGNPVWETVGVQKFDDPLLEEGVVTSRLNWQKVSFPMTAYAGKGKVKVRLSFEYTTVEGRYPMCVDQIEIDDYPAATSLDVTEGEGDTLVLTWDLPASAGEKEVSYNVYQGNEKIASTEDKTYTFTGAEQGESYSFAVEAVYGDGILAPKSEPVDYTVALSSFVVDGVKYLVSDADVYASEYVGDGEAVVIPAKVSYKDTEFNVASLAIRFLNGNRTVKSVDIQAQVETVPAEFCYGCVALSEVKLPASVTEISDKAFFGCAELGTIELPEALATVGASAFEHCEAITEVTFGKDIAEIGAAAFKGAKSLAKVTFKGDVPPAVASDAFSGIASPCEGVCPEGKENDYAAVEGLKPINFQTNGILGIMSGDVASVEYYNLSGARIAGPARGEAAVARVVLRDGTVRTVKVIGK